MTSRAAILGGMETFGQKLRQAIENRGLTIEQVAQVTGLGMQRIRALEEDDFSGLPDDESMAESLRALARLLDVDSDQVVADYRREWARTQAPPAPPAPHGEAGMRVESRGADPGLSGSRSSRLTNPIVPAAIIVAVVAVTLVVWLRSPSSSPPPPSPIPVQSAVPAEAPAPEPAPPPAAEPDRPVDVAGESVTMPAEPEAHAEPEVPAEPEPEPAMPADEAEPPPPAETSPGLLSIPDHGVGTGVVNHELVGRGDRFAEGSRVWYWTLVEGGAAGVRLEHVWLHEGVEIMRVPMTIGGPRWRVKSYKSLNPGSEGMWAVEARDEAGHVLARQEFHCSGRPPS